jgi:hypothetical protein
LLLRTPEIFCKYIGQNQTHAPRHDHVMPHAAT